MDGNDAYWTSEGVRGPADEADDDDGRDELVSAGEGEPGSGWSAKRTCFVLCGILVGLIDEDE